MAAGVAGRIQDDDALRAEAELVAVADRTLRPGMRAASARGPIALQPVASCSAGSPPIWSA